MGEIVIEAGDPIEQSKQIKYANLIANTIMLHNVIGLTDILIEMAAEGSDITKELVADLSPYI